jgi:hypothetical protein
MLNEFIFDWNTALYLLVPCVYLFFINQLMKHWSRRRGTSDEEYISIMARMGECSEYDIFMLASEVWNIPKSRIEGDFKAYLKSGCLPYYVKDYVRKVRKL